MAGGRDGTLIRGHQRRLGIALICSKLIPYVFAVVLSAWTLVYGEHEKKKAERLASACVDAGT